MREMLEKQALPQQRPEYPLAVTAVTRPQCIVLHPHHIVHRVDLQETQIADNLHDISGIQRAGERLH